MVSNSFLFVKSGITVSPTSSLLAIVKVILLFLFKVPLALCEITASSQNTGMGYARQINISEDSL